MNAIQIKNRIEFYLDATRNGRFPFETMSAAVNDAIRKFIDNIFGDIEDKKVYGFQAIQQVRDDLFTLIKASTISPTTLSNVTTDYGTFGVNHINNPSDYYDFIAARTLISGVSTYARPTTYNELGPLLEDSYKWPTNSLPYYLEDSTGYQIYRASTGTLTSAEMTYIKTPQVFSMGYENQLINAGVGVLTLGADYIAVEQSVNLATTFQSGQQFTAASTTLTSGQVILASNTTTTDLPSKVHEIIAKMAEAILSGTIADFDRYSFSEKEVKES